MTDSPSTSSKPAPAWASLPERPLPSFDAFVPHGNIVDDDVIVVLSDTAVDQIQAHNQSDLRVELGGVLLGRAYRQKRRIIVEISAALPAHSDDHGPIHFTFTADAWARIHKDRAAHYPNLSIVGWFHTHPGLGVFYSSDDVLVQSAAFTLPWHVGLVVDPISQEASFFGWKADKVAPIGGFYADGVSVPWTAVETAVWDHEYTYEDYQKRVDTIPYAAALPDLHTVFDAVSPKAGLAAGGIGILLALFLLLFVVMPLSRREKMLETAVLTMADEALATTNGAACPDPAIRILSPISGKAVRHGAIINIIGTANYPDTYTYRVEMRQIEPTSDWLLLESRRRGTRLDELAQWETETYGSGLYEVRLTAVDRNTLILNRLPCSIIIPLE